jgi:hypothetical protein
MPSDHRFEKRVSTPACPGGGGVVKKAGRSARAGDRASVALTGAPKKTTERAAVDFYPDAVHAHRILASRVSSRRQ